MNRTKIIGELDMRCGASEKVPIKTVSAMPVGGKRIPLILDM